MLAPQQHGIDLLTDPLAVARLADAAEAIKIELATKGGSSLNLPFITADASGPKHLRAEGTRSRYCPAGVRCATMPWARGSV